MAGLLTPPYLGNKMTDTTDARMVYNDLGGAQRDVVPVVIVGSVDGAGIPRMLSSTGSSGADLSLYLTSAAASQTYLTQADAAKTYLSAAALNGYLTSTTAASTYVSKTDLDSAVKTALSSIEYSVTGDVSTTGSSISIAFGTSNLKATFAYSAAGAASLTFYSTSGTLAPVDIRRNTIWGGSAVETFTLDNGSVDTSGVVADSTVYTTSQDSSAYFIRVAGDIYFLTVWASNNGARAFMGVHKMI